MELRVYAAFIIAVIACSHLVEGRQIKSVSKKDSRQSSKIDNFGMHKENNQPGASSFIPNANSHNSVLGNKQVLPPPTTTRSSDNFGDDFRPTSINGHSSTEGNEQKQGSISSSNVKHSIAGDHKDDFRPTNPGHSPGIGHAFPSKNSQPNA
ncbi:hypothetical protein PTKIN_Ptkin08bG0105100 [Pterospermum kingtungense]